MTRRTAAGLAAFPLLAACVLAGCTPDIEAAPDDSGPAPGSIDAPLEVGETVSGSTWAVTVTGADLAAGDRIRSGPEAGDGKTYVAVEVDVRNTGPKAAAPFPVELAVVSDGVSVREAAATMDGRLDLLAEMQEDATVSGAVPFLVSAEDAADGLIVSVTPGDAAGRMYVEIPAPDAKDDESDGGE